ncbi:unnamed protein product [Zymoseptoria tritici ST99CH_3D7]|uniref:Uncharacterized protein n=2 Tax=Zymoseptoria tritici TaxID=1047171 RepID=A0A1X7RHW7_ZYMT9|nr:unnamed protein product [Zymoseptoria tritici ST99CH_3D7]SMR42938.1 unnamed protein product [Zymoseptoria tritici ST99CH_1E4]
MSTTQRVAAASMGASNATKPTTKGFTAEEKTARNKYERPPAGYEAPKGHLRVHSNIEVTGFMRGIVLQDWEFCVKPRNAANAGCRSGHWGFYVWHEGVLRKAILLIRKVCNYTHPDDDDGSEHDFGDEDADELDGQDVIEA